VAVNRYGAAVSEERSTRPTWVSEQASILVTELSNLGLTMTMERATQVIKQRREAVAVAMRISARAAQRYIGEEEAKGLAQELAFTIADEQPGVDALAAERTCAVPIGRLGRTISALAECSLIRLKAADDQAVDEFLSQLSMLGLITSEENAHEADVVYLPPALVNRVARSLEATALFLLADDYTDSQMPQSKIRALAEVFEQDAAAFRSLAP
jgi:hypothetical protein